MHFDLPDMIFDLEQSDKVSFSSPFDPTRLPQTPKQNNPCNCFIISIIFLLFSSCLSLTHSPTSGNCYASLSPLLLTSTSSLPSHQPLSFNSFADILRHGTSWKQPRNIVSTSSRESVYPSHIPHTPTSGIRSRTSAAIESSMSGK